MKMIVIALISMMECLSVEFHRVFVGCCCSRLLHGHSHDRSDKPTIHFVNVFLMAWGGAAVVAINAQLLRGKA